MRNSFTVFVLLFISGLFTYLQAQTPKTFYIGHSLSDQIPDMVQSLSNDHNDVDFSWVYQSIPGAPLRWQWDRKDANDYTPIPPNYYAFYDQTYGLPAGDFDVLVLTEAVPRYSPIINETYAYADSLYQYANSFNQDIQVYLYEDWHCLLSGTPTQCDDDVDSNPWRQRLDDDLPMWESVVDTLNARFNPINPVCLIPGGQGLAALYDSIQLGVIPGITVMEDLFSDDIHLNDIGKYFIACIHFAMIHKTSPVGLTNQLQVWWGGDFTAPSPELALKFQEIAWETVVSYPKTCLEENSTVNIQSESESISIFPNPTEDIFIIDGLEGNYSVQVMDVMTNVYQTWTSTGSRMEIDLQSLPSGMYFIRFQNQANNNTFYQKVIKKN